jgi:hypothetical protein
MTISKFVYGRIMLVLWSFQETADTMTHFLALSATDCARLAAAISRQLQETPSNDAALQEIHDELNAPRPSYGIYVELSDKGDPPRIYTDTPAMPVYFRIGESDAREAAPTFNPKLLRGVYINVELTHLRASLYDLFEANMQLLATHYRSPQVPIEELRTTINDTIKALTAALDRINHVEKS